MKVKQWITYQRRHNLNSVFKFLTQGLLTERDRHEGSNGHHK